MESEPAFQERMKRFSTGETVCGPGSTLAFTEELRDWLPRLINDQRVQTLVDAGCGDRNWIKTVDLGCDYQGFDLHHDEVLDISKEQLPQCDLILCRHVLIHMEVPMIQRCLALFAKSSPLLLATNFPKEWDHTTTGLENRKINLTQAPFNLESTTVYFDEKDGSSLELFEL